MDSIRNGGNSDGVSPRRQSANDEVRLATFDVYNKKPFVVMLNNGDDEAEWHDVLLIAATFLKSDGERRILLCQSIVGFRLPTPDGEAMLPLPVEERLKIVVGSLVKEDETLNPDGLPLVSVLVKTRCIGKRNEDGTFQNEGGTDEGSPPSADPRMN